MSGLCIMFQRLGVAVAAIALERRGQKKLFLLLIRFQRGFCDIDILCLFVFGMN